ncbi:MAG: VOC family protein [Pseudomonadota bacterium]
MLLDIHSVGLTVRDLDAAEAFYATEGAYELVSRFRTQRLSRLDAALRTDQPGAEVAVLRGDGGFLELTEFDNKPNEKLQRWEVHDSGLRHVCLRVRDVHQLFDCFVDSGALWHAKPHDLGTGLEYAYVRDLEQNIVELEGLSMMPEGLLGPWFDHAALVTPDIARLCTFYETLTGHTVSRRGVFGPEAKFDTVAGLKDIEFDGAWILFGVSRIEMWQYRSPKSIARPLPAVDDIGWSYLCFEVDHLDKEVDRLAATGVEFLESPQEEFRGRSAFFRDVDGNLVKLLEVNETFADLSISSLGTRPVLSKIREVSEASNRA